MIEILIALGILAGCGFGYWLYLDKKQRKEEEAWERRREEADRKWKEHLAKTKKYEPPAYKRVPPPTPPAPRIVREGVIPPLPKVGKTKKITQSSRTYMNTGKEENSRESNTTSDLLLGAAIGYGLSKMLESNDAHACASPYASETRQESFSGGGGDFGGGGASGSWESSRDDSSSSYDYSSSSSDSSSSWSSNDD